MVQVYGRKKALSAAGAVLLNGVERLRASETMRMTRNMPDFHIDLLRLRQNWRLKKVSNTIVGDLSYRTAGSKFSQTGVFEVSFLFIIILLNLKFVSFNAETLETGLNRKNIFALDSQLITMEC